MENTNSFTYQDIEIILNPGLWPSLKYKYSHYLVNICVRLSNIKLLSRIFIIFILLARFYDRVILSILTDLVYYNGTELET